MASPSSPCPDIRWGRCDIKTTGLLPTVLAKTEARKAGAYEAWLVDEEGLVTEGASTNAWIVTEDDVVVTRAAQANNLLPGVTRKGCWPRSRAPASMRSKSAPSRSRKHRRARSVYDILREGGVMPVVKIDEHAIRRWHARTDDHAKVQSLYREALRDVCRKALVPPSQSAHKAYMVWQPRQSACARRRTYGVLN